MTNASAPFSPLYIRISNSPNFLDRAVLLSDNNNMKISVELSDSELKDICRITGEKKKGPAIRKMVVDTLLMKQREEIASKFIDGKWSAEMTGFEAARSADRNAAKKKSSRWRGNANAD